MATRHLHEESLVDVLDGRGDASTRGHLASCARCAAALDEIAEGLRLAGSADVPERPTAYWEGFERRLRDRIDSGARARASWAWLRPAWIAAAIAAAALSLTPLRGPGVGENTARALPAWSALPAVEDDSGLAILEAYSDDAEGVAEPEVGVCSEIAACLVGLTDEESDAVAKDLSQTLGPQRRDL
jgi:hypothetical protein